MWNMMYIQSLMYCMHTMVEPTKNTSRYFLEPIATDRCRSWWPRKVFAKKSSFKVQRDHQLNVEEVENSGVFFEELEGLKVECSKNVSLCIFWLVHDLINQSKVRRSVNMMIWNQQLLLFPPATLRGLSARRESAQSWTEEEDDSLRMMRRKGSVGCSEGFSDKLEHGWQAIAGEVLLWLCKRCKKQRKNRVYIGLPSNLKWLDLKSGFVSESNIDLCYIYI